jgi:hypothetical protein
MKYSIKTRVLTFAVFSGLEVSRFAQDVERPVLKSRVFLGQ